MPINISGDTGGLGLLRGVTEGLRLGLEGFERERDRRDTSALKDKELAMKKAALDHQLAKEKDADEMKAAGLLTKGFSPVAANTTPAQGLLPVSIGGKNYAFDPGKAQREKLEVAKAMAEARATAENEIKGTPGEQELNKEYAKKYTEFELGGGKATAEGNLSKMATAANDVVNKKASGGFLQKLPFGSDFATRVFQPEKAAVREDVESVVMGSMKENLGSQFTQREGEKVLQTSFDPALPPEIIQARLNALAKIDAQKLAAKNAANEFYRTHHYSLKGYNPPQLPTTAEEINSVLASVGAPKPQGGLVSEANATSGSGLTPDQRQKRIQELKAKMGN